MRAVFLVPRRRDLGHRDALWAWCRARWEAHLPDVPIYEGHHDLGPFNRSAAINRAARLADTGGRWDVAVVIDADIFEPIANVRAAIDHAAAGAVTWAHRRWRGLSEFATKRAIREPDPFGPEPDRDEMDLVVEKTTPMSWSCCIAVPRETFDAMGGFDERFEGWGFEDGAWSALVRGLYEWDRIPGDVFHLWHPRSDERIVEGESSRTALPEYIRNGLLGRRYMIAAIRDHAVGDQLGEYRLTPEQVALHVSNLHKDDQRFLRLAQAKRMPEAKEWADWFPTLEELQEGARAARTDGRPAITVVVTSGGEAETWPSRRDYLATSLESLEAHISGPITQRVVFSDWPEELTPEIRAIASRFGYYVTGGGHFGYTGMRQRLWRYLNRRATGQFLFVAEDDFVYDRDVDLTDLATVLEVRPDLAQVALLRAPAYAREFEMGGILGWPEASFALEGTNGSRILTHRNFWTANPSLFRRDLTNVPWPGGESSERTFGNRVFRDGRLVAALWGGGDAYIRHIGDVRAGANY